MNNNLIIRIVLFLSSLSLHSAMSWAGSITKTAWLYSFDSHVDVTRIDYDKKKTTLYFTTCRHHLVSFSLSSRVYIVGDNGERCKVIGTKGIELDSIYLIGNGKGITFSVDFEPVNAANEYLDVQDPLNFSIFGIHDSKRGGSIKPSLIVKVPSEESDDALFHPQETTIEGILHDPTGELGEVVQINYIPPRPDPNNMSNQTVRIDKDGYFTMKINMYAPQNMFFIKPYTHGYIGDFYARPGDHLFVEVFDPYDNKGVISTNLSGHQTYNKLQYTPTMPYDSEKYTKNLNTQSLFAYMSYQRQREELLGHYLQRKDFAKYICGHYGLSPYETKLYYDILLGDYLILTISSDICAKKQYKRTTDTRLKQQLEESLKNNDYGYLKELNPNDATVVTNNTLEAAINMINQLDPIEECFEVVPKGTPSRWKKIVKMQQDALNRITGWEGMTFIMEQIIINDISYLSQEEIKQEYSEVRRMLKHPFSQTYFDLYINEVMKDTS